MTEETVKSYEDSLEKVIVYEALAAFRAFEEKYRERG